MSQALSHQKFLSDLSRKDIEIATPSRAVRNISPLSHNSKVSNATGRLVRNSPVAVASIFDSCYVKPENNPKVLKDSLPRKFEALKNARSRYERGLSEVKAATIDVLRYQGVQ